MTQYYLWFLKEIIITFLMSDINFYFKSYNIQVDTTYFKYSLDFL